MFVLGRALNKAGGRGRAVGAGKGIATATEVPMRSSVIEAIIFHGVGRMAISITVITTANRARRFLQTDAASRADFRASTQRQLFSGKPLIIGSAGQTEVFAPASIACLEIETDSRPQRATCPALEPDADGTDARAACRTVRRRARRRAFQARIEFFFTGGHVLYTTPKAFASSACRAPDEPDQPLRPPAINYRLAQGGIGLMNPHAMTRFVITPACPTCREMPGWPKRRRRSGSGSGWQTATAYPRQPQVNSTRCRCRLPEGSARKRLPRVALPFAPPQGSGQRLPVTADDLLVAVVGP
jgi:hypothetical protein